MTYKCPVPNCNEQESYEKLNTIWLHFLKHLSKSDVSNWLDLIRGSDDLNDRCKDYLIKKSKVYLFNLQDNNVDNSYSYDAKPEPLGNYHLEDYLCSGNPVCREERQYALFLANCLKMNNSNNICRLIMGDSKIIDVFYEATFLRDYWYRDKEMINEKLWKYVNKNVNDAQSEIYQNTERHPNYWGIEMKNPVVMWMMNAKPDIAVLWENGQGVYLSFIECKYLSDLGEYTYTNNDKEIVKTQLKIQEYILDFLCNELKLLYSNKSVNYGSVKIVRFVANNKKKGDDEIEIMINDLLNYTK